jgi:predicted XRE-type DNA-binding protein
MKARKPKDEFPNAEKLKRVRDKLSDPSFQGGNLALPANASEVDRAKYETCQIIARFQRTHNLRQKDVAEKLGVDESRVSDILRGKIEGFTLDRLAGYAEKLHPGLKIKIVAA